MLRIFLKLPIIITSIFCILCINRPSLASVYDVAIDTSPLYGHGGFVDIQFNPGDTFTLAANAMISRVRTDGLLSSTAENYGGAVGFLPGPPDVIIDNVGGYNDIFQGIVFGNSLAFEVGFSGIALSGGGTSGSVFSLSLYDADGFTTLLSSSADGSLLHIDIAPNGVISVSEFSDEQGIYRASATEAIKTVPVSDTVLLFGAALASLGIFRKRRRRV